VSRKWALVLMMVFWILPLKSFGYSRIISLKPNITEILFALGLGDKVVGVTTFCDRPPSAAQVPRVADYIRVNPEKALALKPDLILGSKENSSQKEIYFLEERGIPVKLLDFATIPQTLQSIQVIGNLLGKSPEAQKITRTMKGQLEEFRKRVQGAKWKRALFVVGYQPLVVAGQGNFFDEASPYIGTFNVARESKLKYPTWSTEQLIRSQPEIIFDISMDSRKSEADFPQRLQWWRQFRSIPAVRWNQIYYFNIEKMRAVPSLPQALEELYRMIHRSTLAPQRSRTGLPGDWAGLPLKDPEIVIHKEERRLELFSEKKLLRTYKIALGFEPVGGKQKQGDGKTPEGQYFITGKNPKSKYFLSLALNYPNGRDGKRGYQEKLITRDQYRAIRRAEKKKLTPPWDTPLGGEIFIHGHGSSQDWTLGCIALDNPDMKELYRALPVGTPVKILP